MSKNIIYDETMEQKLDDFLRIIVHKNLDMFCPELVLNKLLDSYEKTKYPGILYRLGLLYEQGFFKKLKEDKTIHYYEQAAKEGYVLAMNALARIGLQRFFAYKFKYASWARESAIENNNSEGKYLLAKYCMLTGLIDVKCAFKDGMKLMKESASDGYEEAIDFIKMNDWRII